MKKRETPPEDSVLTFLHEFVINFIFGEVKIYLFENHIKCDKLQFLTNRYL